MTQQRLWIAFAVIAGMSFALQVAAPLDLTDRPETTFDSAPRGHAALFALLDRFDSTSGRWLSGVAMPPVSETIWWIAPAGACEAAPEVGVDVDVDVEVDVEAVAEGEGVGSSDTATPSSEAPRHSIPSAFEITVLPWLESGGTALVWLSRPPLPTHDRSDWASVSGAAVGEADGGAREDDPQEEKAAGRARWEQETARSRELLRAGVERRCESILGFPIPARRLAGLEGGQPPEEGRYSPVAFSVGRATSHREDFDYEATRILPGPTLAFFQKAATSRTEPESDLLGEWQPLWVEADERSPLAIERSVGEGRLVLIADARIVSNDRLGHVDSAPFVFDWVRDYGRPWIDEHAHGVVPESGTIRYLATSPAWAAGLGLLLVGALVVWRGHAWPIREVSEFDPQSPTLAAFVDSVARLYAGTQDHARVFERYRRVSLDRVRRALGLAPGTEVEVVLASLSSRAGNWPELEQTGLRHLLTRSFAIPTAPDLARNVARLDDLVRVLRASGQRKTENGQSKATR